ncbi:c-type cytochrome [Alphaproteobacteria bacterium]|nr:c-type cytochrome [Alphaproteobacteria bacterium]
MLLFLLIFVNAIAPNTFAGQRTVFFKYQAPIVITKGKTLYKEHCASCHGDNLEGQENWRQRNDEGMLPAPPHDVTGHTWHHPEQILFDLTKHGLAKLLNKKDFRSDMPAYGESLSDEEIIAVLSFIKSTWPVHMQRTHDQISAHQH